MIEPPRTPKPTSLRVASTLLVVEALAALAFGVLEIGQIRSTRAVVGVGVSVIMIGYGLLLLAMARGVIRGRRWSRGPAVATQLILLPIAWSFRQPPTTWVGLLIGAIAAAVLVGLLHPRSTEVFVGPTDPRSAGPND
ncbi:MAG TPA: hypothetical protein VIT20_08150 [Propionibacteriaceae bacterium]